MSFRKTIAAKLGLVFATLSMAVGAFIATSALSHNVLEANAADETVSPTATSGSGTDFSWSCSKNGGSSDPAFTSSEIRLYAKNQITFTSSTKKFASIVLTTGYSTHSWSNADSNVGTFVTNTWSASNTSTSSVTLTNANEGKGHLKISQFAITFVSEGGGGDDFDDYNKAVYVPTSTSAVSSSGIKPAGSSCVFVNTYSSNKFQMTGGNSQTYTFSGYDSCRVVGLKLSMRSNTSSGSGNLSFVSNGNTLASIPTSAFSSANWNGAYTTSYVTINPTVTPQVIGQDKTLVLQIAATENSLFCDEVDVYWEAADLPTVNLSTDAVAGYTGETTAAISVVSTPHFTKTPTYAWSIDNGNATVNSASGSSTTLALNTAGSATLTCTATNAEDSESATATVSVTITASSHSLSLSSATLALARGGTGTVTPTVTGTGIYSTSTNATLTWSSALCTVKIGGATITSPHTVPSGTSVTIEAGSTTGEAVYTFSANGDTETCTVSVSNYSIDVLTSDVAGVTGSGTYGSWSEKKRGSYSTGSITSDAVYAGRSATNYSSIQLNDSSSDKAVWTTASGGYIRKIVVVWNSSTTSGRTVDFYGKGAAYNAASNFYSAGTQGTKLGSVVYGTSTEINVTGNYKFMGFRSYSGAVYLTSVTLYWEPIDQMTAITPVGNQTYFYRETNWTFGDGASITATYSISGDATNITDGLSFIIADDSAGETNPEELTPSYVLHAADNNRYVIVSYTDPNNNENTKTASYQITVTDAPVTSVTIDQGSEITLGKEVLDYGFTATILPSNANRGLTWSASSIDLTINDDFIFDTGSAELTVATSTTGTIIVTATTVGTDSSDDHLVATCTVTITGERTVTLDESALTAYTDSEDAHIHATISGYEGADPEKITYLWTIESGASYVAIDDVDTDTVTVSFLAASGGNTSTIRCSVTEGGDTKYAECVITVLQGGCSLSWASRGGTAGVFDFFKGDHFALMDGAVLSVSFDNPAITGGTLEISDSRLSLMIYDNASDPVASGREVEIASYTFQKSDNDKHVRIKFDDGVHVAYTNNNGAHQLHIINWRSVEESTTPDGAYDFTTTNKTGAEATTEIINECYSNKTIYPSISNVGHVYVGKLSDQGGATGTGYLRMSTGSAGGTITFTFPTGVYITGLTISARGWTTETPTLSIATATDATKDFTVSSTVGAHDYAFASAVNTFTLTSTTQKRALITTISFAFQPSSVQIGKTSDCLGIESFIDSTLHFDDISPEIDSDTNACRDSGSGAEGYYSTAADAFEALSERQRTLFMTNSAYTLERARFVAWAAANGKSIVKSGDDYVIRASVVIGPTSQESPLTTTLWIVLGCGLGGLAAIGSAYYVSKHKNRKSNQA